MGGGIGVGFYALLGITDSSVLTLTDSTLEHNVARGGEGGNGGDGLGGGLAVGVGSSATAGNSTITHNSAAGGEAGAGGSDGQGVGGGVYRLGAFTPDALTVVKHNHASTSNDDIGP
jgi:hypothetical protein